MRPEEGNAAGSMCCCFFPEQKEENVWNLRN